MCGPQKLAPDKKKEEKETRKEKEKHDLKNHIVSAPEVRFFPSFVSLSGFVL
jgi:hypothetical protein